MRKLIASLVLVCALSATAFGDGVIFPNQPPPPPPPPPAGSTQAAAPADSEETLLGWFISVVEEIIDEI